MMKKLVLAFLIISGNCLAQFVDEELGFSNENHKYQISIYRLAAHPDFFNEKPVLVFGYIRFNLGVRIYADKSSCKDSFFVNSLDVSISDDVYKDKIKKTKKCQRVSVFGVFNNSNDYGNDGVWSHDIGLINGPAIIGEY